MTQPNYVPLATADRVRTVERMPATGGWWADRPGEIDSPEHPSGELMGTPGPDQGYGLLLARRVAGKATYGVGEHQEDAVGGCLAVGLKRAALFGRAPVIYDFDHAFALWGLFDGAPSELVAFRRSLFDGAAHHYFHRRAIADRVPADTLRLTPAQVRERLSDWRSLLDVATTV